VNNFDWVRFQINWIGSIPDQFLQTNLGSIPDLGWVEPSCLFVLCVCVCERERERERERVGVDFWFCVCV
jgi:hypothetical protein